MRTPPPPSWLRREFGASISAAFSTTSKGGARATRVYDRYAYDREKQIALEIERTSLDSNEPNIRRSQISRKLTTNVREPSPM